ncbi:MAG: hypothetical protein ACM3MJ_04200 [Deltaproteobacteria bacterium]
MGAHDPHRGVPHDHDGHDHLRHLPEDAAPAVFAARADVVFTPPARADQLELAVTRFLATLSDRLAEAGCTLVGHIKGTLAARGRGDLAFHATTLGAAPALTGAVAGAAGEVTLTVNVIVFGVDEEALPAIVTGAWSGASDAPTVWRG